MVSSDSLVAVALTAFATYLIYTWQNSRRSQYKLPPGPRGIPILGNLLQFPATRPHPKFLEWARQYGEIFSLSFGGHPVVVLNSTEAVDELLGTRAKDYSSRTTPYVASEVMSLGQRMVLMPYGKEYLASRKAIQNAIGSGQPSRRLRHFQDLESITLMHDFLHYEEKTPADFSSALAPSRGHSVPEDHWFSLVRRFSTSNVMNAMYGERAHSVQNNPHLHKIYDVVDAFTQTAQPGKYIADVFPIFRALPDFLARWRVEVQKLHDWEMELWGGLLNRHKASVKAGTARDCFVSTYLRARAEKVSMDIPGIGVTKDGWMRDDLLAYTGATVLEAGSDTTSASIQSFIMFMSNNPHVLKKAQNEIDEVVGDRLPTFEDEERLPYVVACIKETFRRRPVVPMSFPHAVEKDDVYKGYFIPKGATVFGNAWAIHMDPMRYANPTAFDPDRFYTPGQPTPWSNGPAGARDHYSFGYGRRFCPGADMAGASLFIVCSRLLWAFDLRPLKDNATGRPILPDPEDEEQTWTDGILSLPKTFPAVFVCRSDGKADILKTRYKEIQTQWDDMGYPRDER